MSASVTGIERRRIHVNGIVQGVGFRPFVFRLASRFGLAGSVQNNSSGVTIEIEGATASLEEFTRALQTEHPTLAKITDFQSESMPPTREATFKIITSSRAEIAGALIPPDIAICDDCLRELLDSNDRRFRYPFINCTNCGPRYTIVERIPYDRPYTSMRAFPMCTECGREYHDPSNRRFHAQPNACAACGPQVTWQLRGKTANGIDAIKEASAVLSQGGIVAIRGLGGFHLAVDPRNENAVRELRERKGRAEKPFALMARDIATIEQFCLVSVEERTLLQHYTRPIVLLCAKQDTAIAPSVAPDQKTYGFMLAYTPLQHLLLCDQFDMLVMTSGNYSDEPIAIGNSEALERLASLADGFLLHNREILQRCDDSIARVGAGEPRVIRRSRGYVPEPIILRYSLKSNILAVGGELKNCIALSRNRTVFLSQHIGDLDNPSALSFFHESIAHLEKVLEINPNAIAHDLHPEYLSTKWSVSQTEIPTIGIQHHHAHLVSVMAENGVREKTIGIILDGTGYGLDHTLWGGEVLIGDYHSFERFAFLQPVPMPGGAQAIHQPWRMALSYLYHTFGDQLHNLELAFLRGIKLEDQNILIDMMRKQINSPLTSGCGRLFDAIAVLLGFKREVSFEAQAAMQLELAIDTTVAEPGEIYHDALSDNIAGVPIPVGLLIQSIVRDLQSGVSRSAIALRFHNTLAEIFIQSTISARNQSGINTVGLSGGVFQNVYLFELMIKRLQIEKFTVLTHRLVPTNDGGIALGQVVIADAQQSGK